MKVTKERSCLVVNRVILASFFRRSLIIWPDRQKPTFQETTTRQEDRNKDDGVSGKMTKSGLLGQGGRVSSCHKVNTFSARQEQQEQSEAGATNTTITEISRHHSQKAEIPKKHLTVFFCQD